MQVLYDTTSVRPLDRYDYYQGASTTELAPVAVDGRAPGRLHAAMSVATVGDIELEHVTWSADSTLMTRRTEHFIRVRDPECYRIVLSAGGVMLGEQAGNRVALRTHDMTLYDLSHPCDATHGTDRVVTRSVMVSLPRALVPVPRTAIRPLVCTLVPRALPGRSLITQFLIGLVQPTGPTPDPDLADVLRESMIGLIRVWLGQSSGISPHTRHTLWMAHISNIIRQRIGDPTLNVARIAKAANISPRFLHSLFHGSDLTPMRLVKQLRLQECHRSLQDPALATKSIKDIAAAHGYRRSDQFARDFSRQFGTSATRIRTLAVR